MRMPLLDLMWAVCMWRAFCRWVLRVELRKPEYASLYASVRVLVRINAHVCAGTCVSVCHYACWRACAYACACGVHVVRMWCA
jgi:hypothetical protein